MPCASLTLPPSPYFLVFLHKQQTLPFKKSHFLIVYFYLFVLFGFCGDSLLLYSEDIWSKYEQFGNVQVFKHCPSV